MKFRVYSLFKVLLKCFVLLLLFIVCYFLVAFVCMRIPNNKNAQVKEENGFDIYLYSNGVHTDFVMPINNTIKNWSTQISPLLTKKESSAAQWIAFGWGDKGFYLDTPSWADLKFKTAFNALFYMSSTAMHVSFYESMTEHKRCKKIRISAESYQQLVRYIENSFETKNNEFCLIKNASYSSNDLFFDARGKYSLFNTCNTWVNSGLKQAGLKACLWTPFDKGIFYQYQ